MILLIFHDRRSLANVASIKGAIEECYGPYGLMVQESGYLYVPLEGRKLNAALLLKYLGREFSTKRVLWLVDRELLYPKIGPIAGCTSEKLLFFMLGSSPRCSSKRLCTRSGTSWAWSTVYMTASCSSPGQQKMPGRSPPGFARPVQLA